MPGEILDLHRQLPGVKGEAIFATAVGKIDGLVYWLYGLSDEEVELVEGG